MLYRVGFSSESHFMRRYHPDLSASCKKFLHETLTYSSVCQRCKQVCASQNILHEKIGCSSIMYKQNLAIHSHIPKASQRNAQEASNTIDKSLTSMQVMLELNESNSIQKHFRIESNKRSMTFSESHKSQTKQNCK